MGEGVVEEAELVLRKAQRKHPKALCETCPWFEHSGFADAKGPESASILLVGIAPGADECQTGKPFTGPSGRLLDKVLAHHQFDNNDLRFTNVVACHPPFVRGQKPVDPPKEVISCCEPRLREELRNRKTIICLGNVAKEAILHTREPITRVRQGPPRTHASYPNTKIVATLHPAAVLRQSDAFPSLVKDLGKAKNTDIYVRWEPPEYRVFDNTHSAVTVLNELLVRRQPYLTLDIEVGVEKDTSYTHPTDLLCVGLGFAPNKAVVIGESALRSPRVKELIRKLVETQRIICQNGKFDLQVLIRLGIITAPNLWADTMLASYVLDERAGIHGLKGMSSERLGAPNYAAELDKYLTSKADSYAKIPREVLYRYNAYDAALTYNLWHQQLAFELESTGLRHVHDRLVNYSNELVWVELDGVGVDLDYLEEIAEDYALQLELLEHSLADTVGRDNFNPRSPKQVSAVMTSLGIPHRSTNIENLKSAFERSRQATPRYDFLDFMMKYRREHKLASTYIKGTRKRLLNGRVYPTYLLHGSTSGRLACRNPNLQNVPRESSIRKLFVPDEGNTFVQADYAGIELRVATCYAKDKYLQQAFLEGRDIHSELAEKFYGPNFTKDQRVRAKAITFGSLYDRQAPSIAHEHKMTIREAERFLKEWFEAIPEIVAWRKRVHDLVFTGGRGQALQTHFGRKRRFWLITSQNRKDIEKESLAFLPQSTANDINLSALCTLRQAFGTAASAPKIRIPVHDSILTECANSDVEEVAQTKREVMEQTAKEEFDTFVNFPVDLAVGPSWGDLRDV